MLIVAYVVAVAYGHGRLANPVGRGSTWRLGYDAPANYDDDGMNCGGFSRHWEVNSGKCGICGDAFDHPAPRAHELGGTYGQGYIVANYQAGDVVPITVYLSASHLGYWELKICTDPHNNEQDCFDQTVELEDGSTKYYPLQGSGTYTLNYRIPDISCDHCVLQWRYNAGNNWGVCEDGTGALGCGNQENFFSCADISITGSSNSATGNGFVPVVNAPLEVPSPLVYFLANSLLETKGEKTA